MQPTTLQLWEVVIWGLQGGHWILPLIHLADWRSTWEDNGGLCVMTSGMQQTPVWLVVSLDFLVLSVHSMAPAVQ